MAGYENRFIRHDFPELGENIFVEMRNPMSCPPDLLNLDGATDINGHYVRLARLIRNWHVLDATSDEDDQPELALPATPESVRQLPSRIVMTLIKTLNEGLTPP